MVAQQLERLRRAFGLSIDPKMVETEQSPQKNAGLLVSGDHDRAGRGTFRCAHGPSSRDMGRPIGPSRVIIHRWSVYFSFGVRLDRSPLGIATRGG